jgi:dihydrofolate reductase
VDAAQISQIGLAGEPELVLLLSIELDLIVRADPCQARPVAANLVRSTQSAASLTPLTSHSTGSFRTAGLAGQRYRAGRKRPEGADAFALQQLPDSDALLMGRRTYDVYADVWPGRGGDYADRMNTVTKYVASTTLQAPDWANTTVLNGDLAEAVTKLKQATERTILIHGHGPVAKTLVRHGLLHELVLWVHPMLAGVGTPSDMLISDGLNARLTLADVKTLSSGVVILSCRPN